MSSHSTLDREFFQKLLASAFVVQQYLDHQRAKHASAGRPLKPTVPEQPKEAILPDCTRSLSAVVEVQRLIATDELDVDGAMHLIADGVRNVANATGVAIGLLEGDELVYRAGSGSAATYIGRHVKATLSVSAHNLASGEILRVENADTDARIAAAICRQFGAKALLIVPIYHDRAVAGVLKVLFSDAHAFQAREVRTYQLLAGLVAEAMSHAAQLELKQALAAERATTRQALEKIAPQLQKSLKDSEYAPPPASKHLICRACGHEYPTEELFWGVCGTPRIPGNRSRYDAAAMTPFIAAPNLRAGAADTWEDAAETTPSDEALEFESERDAWRAALDRNFADSQKFEFREEGHATETGAVAVITQGAKRVPLRPWKAAVAVALAAVVTVLVMANWIAYTNRRPLPTSALQRSNAIEQQVPFVAAKLVPANSTSKPQTAPVPTQEAKKAARSAPQRVQVGDNQVDYITEDVTVRYFTPKPAVAPPKQPVGSTAQPVAQHIQPPVVARAAEQPEIKQIWVRDKPEIKQISVQDKKCGQGHLGRRLACWLHQVCPIRKIGS